MPELLKTARARLGRLYFFTKNNETPSNAAFPFQFFIENIKIKIICTRHSILHTRDLKQSCHKWQALGKTVSGPVDRSVYGKTVSGPVDRSVYGKTGPLVSQSDYRIQWETGPGKNKALL